MNQLKNKPWFIVLLVVFFILHGAVENFGFIYFSEVIKITISIFISVAILFLCIKIFIKKNIHAALITFFISSWILFFGAIFDWVKRVNFLSILHSYSMFVPFMLLMFILFILFIQRKIDLQNKLCFYLNVLLLIYCLFDVASLILKSFKANYQTSFSAINFDATLVKNKPNVYFLLFDEYPGYKSLKDSFGFSNDKLYQFLADKEFKTLPTFSNYNMTFYSIASMLNLQYINKPFTPLQNTMDNDQQRIKEINNSSVVQYFESTGYSFINFSGFDILDKPSIKGNSFVISQAKLITNKIFFNKILNDLGWHFIQGKYKLPYLKYIYMQDDRNNKAIEKGLVDHKFMDSTSAHFIYAHFNMPHPLIYYDSAGNYLPDNIIFDPNSYENKTLFLGYIKFVNSKIEKIVNAIDKNDPKSIIILMSDHGYRAYKNTKVIEPLHFDNICFVRFPDKNYLPVKEKWSNVNIFRYLFNCEFNQKIPYLQDSTIFLKDINSN